MPTAPARFAPPFLSRAPGPVPCTSEPDLFHAPDDPHASRGARGRTRTSAARRLCRSCPVMALCRAWGRDHRELGIWGGENDMERNRARRSGTAPVAA